MRTLGIPPLPGRKSFKIALLAGVCILSVSCAPPQKDTRTLTEIKANLTCIAYQDQMPWQEVEQLLGEPGAYPASSETEGRVSEQKWSRVYSGQVVIFHTEKLKVESQGSVRFREMVTGVEVCKAK